MIHRGGVAGAPGSVTRPVSSEIMICDAGGEPVPPGTDGEVWMRSDRERPTYRYVGAEARRREGGGSRSATSATWTRRATCTWATGWAT